MITSCPFVRLLLPLLLCLTRPIPGSSGSATNNVFQSMSRWGVPLPRESTLAVSPTRRRTLLSAIPHLRGGEGGGHAFSHDDYLTKNNDNSNNDEERYSRQFYALGARAHALVRSCTILLDGPPASGLLYETGKNLALSGVGQIILLTDDPACPIDESTPRHIARGRKTRMAHESYHDSKFDDLGCAYMNAARAEVSDRATAARQEGGKKNQHGEVEILVEYLRRLNPSVRVSTMKRSEFLHRMLLMNRNDDDDDDDDDNDKKDEQHREDDVWKPKTKRSDGNENNTEEEEEEEIPWGNNPVLLCVDRPQSTQLELNSACRRCGSSGSQTSSSSGIIPFVSIETAGVFGRAFCDFGPNFVVEDEDGETPKITLLDHFKLLDDDENDDEDTLFVVQCVEGEMHDVSKGDRIVFQFTNGGLGREGMAPSPTGSPGGTVEQGGNESMQHQCEVVHVKNPTCFTVRRWFQNNDENVSSMSAHEFVNMINSCAKSFTRVKIPRHVSFISLSEAIDLRRDSTKQLFAPSDLDKSFDVVRRSAVMSSFAALSDFAKKYHCLPSKLKNEKEDDSKRFRKLARKIVSVGATDEDGKDGMSRTREWRDIVATFAMCCRAKLTPVQALFGALGAQEALKAASGLYNPIQQFLLYDCDELLQFQGDDKQEIVVEEEEEQEEEEDLVTLTGAAGQIYVLGKSLTRSLSSCRLFVVGSGAIGCEILKNLSAMGAGADQVLGGRIIVTDMDTIEKSNLSRQLLFRDADVGKFKSAAAQQAVLRFNPRIRIEAHTTKVGDDGGGPFDDAFWSDGIDVVLNALDNMEARLYIDGQCVAHRKALVDAGTLGSKGNVQVVVPDQSESYGSSADPPEPSIPVCTLKNFPYDISHTIQWARDLFDGLYNRRPGQVNDNADALSELGAENFAKNLVRKLGEDAAIEAAEEMGEDFVGARGAEEDFSNFITRVRESSIAWAVKQANSLFRVAIEDLLRQHPVDSLDEDGTPFWSGTRTVPKILCYVASSSGDDVIDAEQAIVNDCLVDFVRTAARLRIEMFLPQATFKGGAMTQHSNVSVEEAISALQKPLNESHSDQNEDMSIDSTRGTLLRVMNKLDGAVSLDEVHHPLNVVEFEKDDETNGHVAFVTAASNLRAVSYGIPPADSMETRRVAGRIVPAMITTTAFVSALSCIELLKLLQRAPLRVHRNAFVNLALPFFAFTSPLPAEEVRGLNGKTYTLWDRITIKEGKKAASAGGLTLKGFLRRVKKAAGADSESVDISTVSYGQYMIYANFMHDGDESLLSKSLLELIEEAVVSGDDVEDSSLGIENEDSVERNLTNNQVDAVRQLNRRTFLDLSVVVEEIETSEEVELPPVRFVRWNKSK